MAINAKPFVWSELLKRIYFIGRPAYFNAIDLNKQFDILHNSLDTQSEFVGVYSDIDFSITNFSDAPDGFGAMLRSFDATVTADCFIYYKGVKYEFSAGAVVSQARTYPIPSVIPPLAVPEADYLCLVGDLTPRDFSTEQALCGIQSTEYPTLVPSCTVDRYENVSLAVTHDPSSLGNLICILATNTPKINQSTGVVEYFLFYNVGRGLPLEFQGASNYATGSFSGNGSLSENFNFGDYKYARLREANYFEHTQNLLYNTVDASYNPATKFITLGKGNSHTINIGSGTQVLGITPHSSYRQGTPLYIKLTNNSGLITLIGTPSGGLFVFGTSGTGNLVVNSNDVVTFVGNTFLTSFVWFATPSYLTINSLLSPVSSSAAANASAISNIQGAWTTINPATITFEVEKHSGSGNFTAATPPIAVFKYKKIGKTVHLLIHIEDLDCVTGNDGVKHGLISLSGFPIDIKPAVAVHVPICKWTGSTIAEKTVMINLNTNGYFYIIPTGSSEPVASVNERFSTNVTYESL